MVTALLTHPTGDVEGPDGFVSNRRRKTTGLRYLPDSVRILGDCAGILYVSGPRKIGTGRTLAGGCQTRECRAVV